MICCYEMRKGRGSCVEPSSLKNFGSMFDAEAIHAQIPSNIEPNYQRTWCNGHKTGHASFLSSYIAILPLVSPMFVLGHHMSQRATYETLAIAEQYDYPLVSSHTGFRELAMHGASEILKTREQIARIQRLGGIIAPIINAGDVRNVGELVPALADKVPNDCQQSSKSWAQAYLY